jgi:hypothetical protein
MPQITLIQIRDLISGTSNKNVASVGLLKNFGRKSLSDRLEF